MYGYGDVDAAPTKSYMLKYRNEPEVGRLFELAFGKRPAEELYDLRKDPHEWDDLYSNPQADRRAIARMTKELMTLLAKQQKLS